MRVESRDSEFIVIADRRELEVISNALNEVCHGIDVAEFSTRLGSSREGALALFHLLRNSL
jgi:hypothetical protein